MIDDIYNSKILGFAGNIALKTAEGTARQVGAYLKSAMMQSWLSRASVCPETLCQTIPLPP